MTANPEDPSAPAEAYAAAAPAAAAPEAPPASARAKEPRPAATVVVARPCRRGGIEVLVLRRHARQRFLPGFVVFPGGAIDPGDAELAASLFGGVDQAARACAVRELAEEAGLALTGDGLVEVAGAVQGLAAASASPPRAADLPEISRWVAPEDVPVRFDARFFGAAAPGGLATRADGSEAELAWWARPVDLLEANASGGCSLYWPTMKVLEGLARCDGVEAMLASRIPQVEPEVQIV